MPALHVPPATLVLTAAAAAAAAVTSLIEAKICVRQLNAMCTSLSLSLSSLAHSPPFLTHRCIHAKYIHTVTVTHVGPEAHVHVSCAITIPQTHTETLAETLHDEFPFCVPLHLLPFTAFTVTSARVFCCSQSLRLEWCGARKKSGEGKEKNHD